MSDNKILDADWFPDGLTPKQALFVVEFTRNGFNGTQAAIKAGYSAKSASVISAENLNKPHVKHEIEKRLKAQANRLLIDGNAVLSELYRIALSGDKDTDRIRACETLAKHLNLLPNEVVINMELSDTGKDFLSKLLGKDQ